MLKNMENEFISELSKSLVDLDYDRYNGGCFALLNGTKTKSIVNNTVIGISDYLPHVTTVKIQHPKKPLEEIARRFYLDDKLNLEMLEKQLPKRVFLVCDHIEDYYFKEGGETIQEFAMLGSSKKIICLLCGDDPDIHRMIYGSISSELESTFPRLDPIKYRPYTF